MLTSVGKKETQPYFLLQIREQLNNGEEAI